MTNKHKITEEIYTHEYLWRAGNQHLEQATQAEGGEEYYSYLSALLFYSLAFEAFINFLGEALLPDIWENEKDYFKGEKAGLEGKIKELHGELKRQNIIFKWEKGVDPYQSIKRLEEFRHQIVHGKFIKNIYLAEPKKDGTHIKWEMPWDSLVNPTSVNQSRNAIQTFSQTLLTSVRECADHLHLIHDAFTGSLGTASGESTRG